ncbi:MAG: 2'-5' RNA ligase family protein [Phenylobacterium sp.]
MATGKNRLFFALRPEAAPAAEARRLAERLRRAHGLAARPVASERLHISLNFLAALSRPDPQVIDRAKAAVADVRTPAFVVALDRVGTWGRGVGARPVVIHADDGVTGVRRLHAAIHAALAGAGLVRRLEPEIEPHLTLLRDTVAVPLEFIAPVSWRVGEFVLLNSPRNEGRHEVLGRWPLIG